MTAKYVQCRYMRRNDERCTAEAVDEEAPVLLCTKHLARAARLFSELTGPQGLLKKVTA